MNIRIALAGNPNCGKTTLYNALTGSNQFVGNWPGVTVEKKEGKLKKHEGVTVTDLPGIYSLSPYTLEEVVARNYLVGERPDVILNIIDGTNIERNLYLTTQLTELGIPVVIAVNMMDVVRKNGDEINIDKLSRYLGCRIVEISALREEGIAEAAEAAIEAAKEGKTASIHCFSGVVEHTLAHIEEACVHEMPAERQRWYAVKIFERDSKVLDELKLSDTVLSHIENDIAEAEQELDDDSESIITNERYNYIESIIGDCHRRKNDGSLTVSERIDRVVTGRWAALPIFAVIMFLVYYISVTLVGGFAADWANNGVFGEGWHLFGIGTSEYIEDMTEYAGEFIFTDSVRMTVHEAVHNDVPGADELLKTVYSADFESFLKYYEIYSPALTEAGFDISNQVDKALENAPDTRDYGIWIKGIPVLAEEGLSAIGCAEWLQSLIIDGIIGGVGSVLGFVPQMLVLFLLLGFLEACGYMSRIAFVMDRLFRKFGLSGKSFIPMLTGTGCGVTGVMASRTIENERDRRMTVITTTFMPCGAKLPVIALISSALFGGAWWIAPSAYFLGVFAIVISGLMLKKTKLFSGKPSPFVLELPPYHMPTVKNLMNSMWERGSSFIKKAGTVILISSVVIWVGSSFGMINGSFTFSVEMPLEASVIGIIGKAVAWLFIPLGFGEVRTAVATLMGIIAKEEIVGVLGVLGFEGMTKLSAYSFLVFNLLCAPCVAAIAAIRREMNSHAWTSFAIVYQCGFAYCVSFVIYQVGMMLSGAGNTVGIIAALAVIAGIAYMTVRKSPYDA